MKLLIFLSLFFANSISYSQELGETPKVEAETKPESQNDINPPQNSKDDSITELQIGPYISYSIYADATSEWESDSDDYSGEVELTDQSMTEFFLATPPVVFADYKFSFISTYFRDEFKMDGKTEINQNIAAGLFARDNKWNLAYRTLIHPSGKYRVAHDFIVGRAFSFESLLFGGFTKNVTKFLIKHEKYPNDSVTNYFAQLVYTDNDGGKLIGMVSLKGPVQLTYGKLGSNYHYEYGLKVRPMIGQNNESGDWHRGFYADFYGGYARQMTGIFFARVSAGYKMLERSFNSEDEFRSNTLSQEVSPFISVGVETWVPVN